MHDVFQTLRTCSIMELGCNPHTQIYPTHGYDPSKLAIITISDDYGYDQGDYQSIQRMRKLVTSTNSLYDIIDSRATESVPNQYYYTFLVVTENPDYLCDIINLAHAQGQVDKLTHQFNEKYELTKKRKLDYLD